MDHLQKSLAQLVFSHPVHFLAFGFGSGLSPKAPGTVGTLVAIPFYVLMTTLPFSLYLLVTVLATLAGFWICGRSSSMLGVHDHSGIVWDEIVGFWVTMIAAPIGWLWVAMGFVLFRLFDILKPWPASWADSQLNGGIGIVMDDVFAGCYALIVIQLAAHTGWFTA